MADMTDAPFCRTVKSLTPTPSNSPSGRGRDVILFREMVASEAIVRGNLKTLVMGEIHDDERPLVQQIFGNDPSVVAEAARTLEDKFSPDAFDINMGCPVYKLVCDFNGAALMKDPPRAAAIVRAVKAAVKVPVSVKMRLGWSDPNECLAFAAAVESTGADLLTVHGRTRSQGYSGTANWDMIRQVKERAAVPVLANGDIASAPLALDALKQTGCDGVMIGRGALGNPWIFKQIEDLLAGRPVSEVSMEERLRVVKEHARRHVEAYGERGIVTFRKHLVWYFKGLPHAKLLRTQLATLSTYEQLEAILEQIQ